MSDQQQFVVIPQGLGPSPYGLQQMPMRWAAFLADVKDGRFYGARVLDRFEKARWGSVVYANTEEGFVSIVDSDVDSSG